MPSTTALEQLTRERLGPGEIAIALGALALSLWLAFRRERIPAAAAPRDQPRPRESWREVDLFRQQYSVSFERGHLEPSGRSGRRLSLRGATGQLISWRPPDPTFHAPVDASAGQPTLAVLAAGGRAIASLDPVTGDVAFHQADLAQLHGLGRRGRRLLLWPLLLATVTFAVLAHHVLDGFLAIDAGLSPEQLRLSLLMTAMFFAFGEAALLSASLATVSAVMRRVRGAQFHRRHEAELRAFLASADRAGDD